MFSSVGPFFEKGGGGQENFGQKLKFLGFFQLRSPLMLPNVDGAWQTKANFQCRGTSFHGPLEYRATKSSIPPELLGSPLRQSV